MRKALYYSLSLLIMVTGCKKEPVVDPDFLYVSPANDISISADGALLLRDAVKIHVTTNLSWTEWDVSTDQDWCLVSKSDFLHDFYIYIAEPRPSRTECHTLRDIQKDSSCIH